MRLIFPTDENNGFISKRGTHFGKAKFYTIVILEDGKIIDVEGVQNRGHDSGACGGAVSNIMSLNPDALVVGGIGANPAKGFFEAGLDVYVDADSQTVEMSVEKFLQDKLEKLNSSGTCSAH